MITDQGRKTAPPSAKRSAADHRHQASTMTNLAIPTTENPGWGFFGTMTRQASASPTEAAWNAALTAIVAATACTPDEARVFLDSRYGEFRRRRQRLPACQPIHPRRDTERGHALDGLDHHPRDFAHNGDPNWPALPDGVRHARRDRSRSRHEARLTLLRHQRRRRSPHQPAPRRAGFS